MKKNGRACICGSIQTYNDLEPKSCKWFSHKSFFVSKTKFFWRIFFRITIDPTVDLIVKEKHIKLYELSVYNYEIEWPEAFKEIKQLLEQVRFVFQLFIYDSNVYCLMFSFKRTKSKPERRCMTAFIEWEMPFMVCLRVRILAKRLWKPDKSWRETYLLKFIDLFIKKKHFIFAFYKFSNIFSFK